ncbi:hypothetical protein RUND412_009631, partial [Rhizina undulata]
MSELDPKDQNQNVTSSDTTAQQNDGKDTTPADAARERKLGKLRADNRALEKELVEVREKRAEVLNKLKNSETPEETVKHHIKLLHDFNDIRDVGLGLIGLVAENRQVRVQDVMP